MTSFDGYPVMTTEDQTVGHVVAESELAWLVECGLLRKRCHALPKQFASIDQEEGFVRMHGLSKEMLAESPKLKREAPLDDFAIAAWWGID